MEYLSTYETIIILMMKPERHYNQRKLKYSISPEEISQNSQQKIKYKKDNILWQRLSYITLKIQDHFNFF